MTKTKSTTSCDTLPNNIYELEALRKEAEIGLCLSTDTEGEAAASERVCAINGAMAVCPVNTVEEMALFARWLEAHVTDAVGGAPGDAEHFDVKGARSLARQLERKAGWETTDCSAAAGDHQ